MDKYNEITYKIPPIVTAAAVPVVAVSLLAKTLTGHGLPGTLLGSIERGVQSLERRIRAADAAARELTGRDPSTLLPAATMAHEGGSGIKRGGAGEPSSSSSTPLAAALAELSDAAAQSPAWPPTRSSSP